MKPKLLDLFCKAGGASKGYSDAGFDVYGVDIEHQPNYMHPGKFIKSDAIIFLKKYGHLFDVIAASPPCQAFSRSTSIWKAKGYEYPDMIGEVREAIEATGLPGIIENVPQAPIRPDIILRGDLFDLKVIRVRHFELINWMGFSPQLPVLKGSCRTGDYVSVFGKGKWRNTNNRTLEQRKITYTLPEWRKKTVRETWAYAMGIDWYMKDTELANAIPPAYTKYIGEQLITYLDNKRKCSIPERNQTAALCNS